MAFNSNGQISYLVLDSLADSSKYGLEIIEYISKKTHGGYIMKKPTLYSCLTRMEKKGLVSSSYWGESELGGKRHYYNITPAGRETLAELSREFKDADFSEDGEETPPAPEYHAEEPVMEATSPVAEDENKPTYLQQDNLFDMVKTEPVSQAQDDEEEDDVLDNQIDIFNMEPVPQQTEDAVEEPVVEQDLQTEEPEDDEKIKYYQSILEQEPKQDDGVFLSDDERAEELTPDQEEQNKRLYDTSNDFKKYKSRKSFSENQIEMSVVYNKEEDDELQKERIAELKRSIINMREQNNTEYAPQEEQSEQKPAFEPFVPQNTEQEQEQEEVQDDGVFITGPRMDESEVPIQRKIAPTNIEVNIYDDNLPAPKRNSNLEPTYKDMMSKIFERRKEHQVQEQVQPDSAQSQNYADYNSLKRHYTSHNIDFKEYKKTNVNRNYNTNLLQLIASIVLLSLSVIGSLALLWIVAGTHNLNSSTNFMFYTLPGLFLLYTLYSLIKYKCFNSKKASLRYTAATNWIVFLLATLVVVIVNTICGMQIETMASYITSLTLPVYCLLILFPINFYTKKFLYRKYAK